MNSPNRKLPQPPPAYTPGIGKGDFFEIGNEFVELFKSLAHLEPHECVLDVGCGLGRIAGPLTNFLTSGSYEGFDVVSDVVGWCERNLSPLHPRFRFQLADVFNSSYNPTGQVRGEEFRFPYDSDSFDFVFLASVFTHMLEDETARYVREIGRVLKPSGRVFSTFFVVDDVAKSLIAMGRTSVSLKHVQGNCLLSDLNDPHQAVGYSPEWIRNTFEEAGLRIDEPFHFGNWCERPDTTSYQDIVIASPEQAR